MKRIILFSFILLISMLKTSIFCFAQKQALVIGNSNYNDLPLRNPVNDANDMASILTSLGFSVTKKLDVNQQVLEKEIRKFGNRLQAGDVALFYFSGHGSQVKGINYLIPIDSRIYSEDEIKYKAVDAGMVCDKMGNVGTKLNIIILDACRNNPFKSFRSASRGLAMMSAPTGTLIAYSTAPGTVAYDGTGRNSPYTKGLLKTIKIPGLKIEEVFKKVRLSVMAETNDKQVPWESSSLTGDFYFLPINKVSAEEKVATQAEQVENTVPGKYPEASTRLLTKTDIEGKSLGELRILRNEIFARYGYVFTKDKIIEYFNQKPWYKPEHKDVSFIATMLTEIEKANIKLIEKYESDCLSGKLKSGVPGKYPEASIKYLTEADIKGKSANELEIMRNEVFARHGFKFKTSKMNNYFSLQSWYKPRYDKVYFLLTEIEEANIRIIIKQEKEYE